MILIKFKDGMVEDFPGDRQNVKFADQSGTPVVVCNGPEGQLIWLVNMTTIQCIEFYQWHYDETQKKIHNRLKKALEKEKDEKQ